MTVPCGPNGAPRGRWFWLGAWFVARLVACFGGWLALIGGVGRAAAQEVEPLMAEPVAYTDVLDAFDDDDPIDVNVTLGFHRLLQSGSIQREATDFRTTDGRSTRRFIEVAQHERTSNELALLLELGVYHDLMLFGRVPILLSEERELSLPDGVSCRQGTAQPEACGALLEPVPGIDADEQEPLFERTVIADKRSGIPRFELGVAYGPFNQHRGSALGTWVLRVQASFPVGPLMRPCLDAAGCDPGVSRGTSALELESRWSYRFRYLEPYLGLGQRFEWVTSGRRLFTPAGELPGDVDASPPQTTTSTLGVTVIPWEDRGRHQRFGIDLRASAELLSAGRDFSPLFDALGSSRNAYLTVDQYDRVGGSRQDAIAVPFTGLTAVEAHQRLGLALAFLMRAARYVRFGVGISVHYLTPHLLTGEPSCNASAEAAAGDPRRGDCGPSLLNPSYRAVIDAPGQRFRLDGDVLLDSFLSATAQF